MEENKNQKGIQLRKDIGSSVIARIEDLQKSGFTMPKDYNFVNAIKSSLMKLGEKNKSGKSLLEICTQKSIGSALFEMCTKGLNLSLNQCYMIPYGSTCTMMPSYFGNILRIKRIYHDFDPIVQIIREGDVFEYGINPETGKKFLIKHEQKLENIDKDFVGGYMYLPCSSGGKNLFIMTKKQIKAAWLKSSTKQQVHKEFDEKMASKTIINSASTIIINSTPDDQNIGEDEDVEKKEYSDVNKNDFEEIEEYDEADYSDVDDKGENESKEEPREKKEDNTSDEDKLNVF